MITVLIVDDHAVVRAGLRQLMATADDIEVVGEAEDGATAVAAVSELTPDVVLMDLSMPGVDGVEATRRIKESHPLVHVVVLTSFSDQTRILSALETGADGYLLKHSEPQTIIDAVRSTVEGGAPLDPRAARVLLSARSLGGQAATMSARERQVLRLVVDGLAKQADRAAAGHLRAHRQGAPDQRVPADRRARPHPGRAVGAGAPRRQLTGRRFDHRATRVLARTYGL